MRDFIINLMKLNDNISLRYKDILCKYDLSNDIEKPTRNFNMENQKWMCQKYHFQSIAPLTIQMNN